jgi:hypothetical protein
MQPVRTMVAVQFAAAILAAGCSAHTSTDQPSPAPPAPNLPHGPRLPIHRSGPAPVDRQAPIYAVVLRQYLTSGGGHDGGDAGYGGFRFPHIFVVDHAVAGANTLARCQRRLLRVGERDQRAILEPRGIIRVVERCATTRTR